ncbi:J domain-containing protein required for chloroplast accumulation response 1 isoform X2 [Magnolia sinica]|uniref:J domain-containing protein required for chloroplast accumulation response 1 isoform X2 n=1 Tax=Magnolia sinica TaxID=86752 RepID=UPI0026589D5E|nr:J domain-containing protein required for chloroplast accumulation response 1 isoform X2 [Magnolia sinica]
MEKLSYRDNVFLGYVSRRSLGNLSSSSKIPNRSPDIDFDDVFGGPPRCSMTEMRHSLGKSANSYLLSGGEDTPSPNSPWLALSEKPVFGDDSPSRRKHLSGDFFDDIFKGEESSSSTPRKPDSDIFSSAPASRILSPARPLPPNREPFIGASSLPAHLSLSSKLPKGIDLPTFRTPSCSPIRSKDGGSNGFGFLSSPSICVSRLATQTVAQTILGEDDSRNDTRPSYRHSRLSHEFSLNGDGSSKVTESAIQDTEGQCVGKKDRVSSEASNDNNQFHFSIYKWASKGVTLMMPAKGRNSSNTKERGKTESIVSGLPAPVLQGVNLPSQGETMSAASSSFRFQCDSQDSVSSKDINILRKDNVDEEAMPSEPEASASYTRDSYISEKSGREKIIHCSGSAGPPVVGFCKGGVKEVNKPELKSLGSLLKYSSDDPGKEEVAKRAGEKDGSPILKSSSAGAVDDSVKAKKPIGRKSILNHAKTISPNLHNAPLNSEDKMIGNRVKGKVKEFVKIFNQEASPKLASHVDARGHNPRRKESGARGAEDLVSVCATKDKINNENSSGTFTDTPVGQILKKTVEKFTHANTDAHKVHDSSSERNDIPDSCPESTTEGFKDAIDNIEESDYEDIHVSCLVEQLPEEQKEKPKPIQHQEEIQISDARIRQWSNGKEGNIRSLLSTLQYVLWPDSGWKPVPLVDVIEGTSVRRAYQKALLCLHPDKLQQRGAAMHQKYIAEKVFDILQEAWTHFNSASSI